MPAPQNVALKGAQESRCFTSEASRIACAPSSADLLLATSLASYVRSLHTHTRYATYVQGIKPVVEAAVFAASGGRKAADIVVIDQPVFAHAIEIAEIHVPLIDHQFWRERRNGLTRIGKGGFELPQSPPAD